jgi:hypothetical protein
LVEEIWVNVAEATKITGYNLDHVRRLARENWRLPEDQRRIRVRKDDHAYAIWLPDLINYVERRIPPLIQDADLSSVEEIWVTAGEAVEATGYSSQYMTRLAMKMQKKPENEREIQLRKRSNRYEMWLPDLLAYMLNTKLGRPAKHKLTD